MSTAGLVLVGLAMAVGLVGVLVPALPGLLLIWAAGLVWALEETGRPRWVVLAVMSALLVAGTVAKYVLPGRAARGAGAPRSSLLLAGAAAVVGFFVVPVVGAVLFGVGALFLAETRRLGDRAAAWRATRTALVAVGIGVACEVAAGVAMALTWLVAVLAVGPA